MVNKVDLNLNSKTAGHTAKQSEIWDSGTLLLHILGTFGLVGFKVILGSVSAFVSKLSYLINGLS